MPVKAQIVLTDTEKRDYRNKRHNSAYSPELILRPSPATGHEAEILEQ
jgi:hypothetical protein